MEYSNAPDFGEHSFPPTSCNSFFLNRQLGYRPTMAEIGTRLPLFAEGERRDERDPKATDEQRDCHMRVWSTQLWKKYPPECNARQ